MNAEREDATSQFSNSLRNKQEQILIDRRLLNTRNLISTAASPSVSLTALNRWVSTSRGGCHPKRVLCNFPSKVVTISKHPTCQNRNLHHQPFACPPGCRGYMAAFKWTNGCPVKPNTCLEATRLSLLDAYRIYDSGQSRLGFFLA